MLSTFTINDHSLSACWIDVASLLVLYVPVHSCSGGVVLLQIWNQQQVLDFGTSFGIWSPCSWLAWSNHLSRLWLSKTNTLGVPTLVECPCWRHVHARFNCRTRKVLYTSTWVFRWAVAVIALPMHL